jgi:Acyl-CoA dehydrogenase, C-terminal domain
MDDAQRALLQETVRDAIADADTNGGGAAAVDTVLARVDWLEMLAAERRDAIDIVFTALGATNGMASVLDDVVVSALGTEPRSDLAVLLPPFTAWRPPGRTDGEHASALGLATARVATAGEMLVVCGAGEDLCAATVPTSALEVDAVEGIDPDAGFHTVRVEHDAVVAARLDAAPWESAIACGRRAVAHQIAGACRAMLDLARAHALERVQFDRPIARFQAVRHRLAEALVAVEALEATLTAAGDQPSSLTAALAKAAAGRTAQTVAGHCQQVLGGIGFTTDHPFHGYLKRTMALEGIFGSADDIALAIGRELVTARRVPTLIEL